MNTVAHRSPATGFAVVPQEPDSTQTVSLTLTVTLSSDNSLSMSWNNESVTVNQAIANFTITLSSTIGATLNGEIRWYGQDRGHIKQPPAISKLSHSSDTITFTDTNPQDNKTWRFLVWVTYQGNTYASPDPTIINADIGSVA
jgi:hypothetical protein